jgi:hypothetical protein
MADFDFTERQKVITPISDFFLVFYNQTMEKLRYFGTKVSCASELM